MYHGGVKRAKRKVINIHGFLCLFPLFSATNTTLQCSKRNRRTMLACRSPHSGHFVPLVEAFFPSLVCLVPSHLAHITRKYFKKLYALETHKNLWSSSIKVKVSRERSASLQVGLARKFSAFLHGDDDCRIIREKRGKATNTQNRCVYLP